ncbi:YARHG domain-containing protein [Aquimarina brevivitae]|uniref:YARHG domain-containing protein n=1 Tax=Aquimarina brevivitae TaxID=323412 RepID=A0A4Q7PH96_9FLAO|nr:YARHG domain-containing protein [Aquimarina brevivitae]RZS99517.1 YARHG domain-containing protein [Aquimarina brevivitae]
MKPTLILLLAICNISCDTKEKKNENIVSTVTEENTSEATMETTKPTKIKDILILKGIYVGQFHAKTYDPKKKPSYSNKINITIDSITNDSVYGHSVVAGNSRPFSGELIFKDDEYSASVSEPGDDKYDGHFNFSFIPAKEKIEGFWVAYDQNLAVTVRSFELKKTVYTYNPDRYLIDKKHFEDSDDFMDYFAELYSTEFNEEGEEYATMEAVKINASNTELTKEDVENLYKGDLEIIRNAIYARHGYSFKNRKMRYFFDSYVDWYIPMYTDIRDKLTALEVNNIALIKRYEQHAERYYDYFGR